MWCVAELDEEYIARMEDVLDLYERPLDAAEPVVCLDERPVALHGQTRPASRVKPCRPARYDYEYVRNGTANIFCAVQPLAGKHITKVTPSRRGVEFAKMLGEIARRYRRARSIHLVLDNLSTHSAASLCRQYGNEQGMRLWSRFAIHHTPKHGSWLNQAEIGIGLLNRQCLDKRRLVDRGALRQEVRAWTRRANGARLPIAWRFTAEKARITFGYKPTACTRSED